MFKNILVCLDGSVLAEQILPYMEAQALQFNSKITLLQVVPLPTDSVVEAGATYINAPMQDKQTQINFNKASAYLEAINRKKSDKGITYETRIIKAQHVGKAIVDHAKENHIDLVGMATHGHGGLGQLVFGSTFEYVLRESGLPILVIKPR